MPVGKSHTAEKRGIEMLCAGGQVLEVRMGDNLAMDADVAEFSVSSL